MHSRDVMLLRKNISRNYYYCDQDENSLGLCFKSMYLTLIVAIFTSSFIFSMFKSFHTCRNINISNQLCLSSYVSEGLLSLNFETVQTCKYTSLHVSQSNSLEVLKCLTESVPWRSLAWRNIDIWRLLLFKTPVALKTAKVTHTGQYTEVLAMDPTLCF